MKEQRFPSRKELLKRLQEESCRRITLSFYRYVIIDDVESLRVELLKKWKALNIFGRIYIAQEGINAQMSVPEENVQKFQKQLYSDKRFKDVPFKIAVEDNGKSFYKLIVKTRKKIVADGLKDDVFEDYIPMPFKLESEFTDDTQIETGNAKETKDVIRTSFTMIGESLVPYMFYEAKIIKQIVIPESDLMKGLRHTMNNDGTIIKEII